MDNAKRAWISAAALAVTLVVNALGTYGRIAGQTQQDVSDKYPTLISPSPFAFAIWGVIYALLLAVVIAMLARRRDGYWRDATNAVSGLYWLSSALNIGWMFAFLNERVALAAAVLVACAAVVALIARRLARLNEKGRWLAPLCFGLYAGWLIPAAVVNVATALVQAGWRGFGLEGSTWAILAIALIALIALAATVGARNAAIALPSAWACLGIYCNLRAQRGYGGAYPAPQAAALVGMAAMIALAAAMFFRFERRVSPTPSAE